jgi:acyl-CoA thioesterase-1
MPRFRARERFALIACLLLAGCHRDAPPQPVSTPSGQAAPAPAANVPTIVVLGDSLTAGLGLQPGEAYPALLQEKLDHGGYHWQVVNAGVSGDTSAAGRARLDWALGQADVRILVLELGANDGLRGLPPAEMKKNLAAIIEAAQAKHIAVLLTGMEAPPNFGPDYTVSFRQVYRDLATEYKVPLLPFLLDKVAGDASLNQGDGIHPNPAGARIVADNVWTALKPLVDRETASAR